MANPTSGKTVNLLTLGWQVDHSLNPIYWLDAGAKPGKQSEHDLVTVPAQTLGLALSR